LPNLFFLCNYQPLHPKTIFIMDEETSQKNTRRLLIVDDEPSFLILLKRIFVNSGFEITTAENGENAKNQILKHGCDVLITDKNLPDISGMDLLKIAKEEDFTTEVIIFTGYDSKETMLEAIDNSAYAYLIKDDVMENIRSLQNRVQGAFEKREIVLENQRLLAHLSETNSKLLQSLMEREKLEEKLVQSEKMAAVGHFSAGIVHELMAPIQGIYSLAQSICSAPDIDLAQNYAQDIIFHTDEVDAVIKEMKSFVNIEEKKQLINIQKSIDSALSVISQYASDSISIVISNKDDISVPIDPVELKQLFINLLKNAMEAIVERFGDNPGGILTVDVLQTNSHYSIRIKDNGNGIRTEDISRLFDPHFTTKKSGPVRVGLGLNIVYRILLKYRGKISVHSDPGMGSTFLITIPVNISG